MRTAVSLYLGRSLRQADERLDTQDCAALGSCRRRSYAGRGGNSKAERMLCVDVGCSVQRAARSAQVGALVGRRTDRQAR